MFRGLWRPFLFASLVFACSAAARSVAEQGSIAPRSTPPAIEFDGLGKGSVDLVGPWQFHTGDDPAWASPAIDDSQWEQLRGNDPWGMQGHPGYTGFAWYRLHLVLTPAPGAQPDFAILLSGVEDVYELYWNGVLIGRNGQMPPHQVWYFNQPDQTYGLGPARRGVLSIRVWRAVQLDESAQHGGFENAPVIGSPEAILFLKAYHDFEWLRSQQLNFGLKFLYFLVAILSFLAWLKDREKWYLLWITIYSIFPVIDVFLFEVRFPLSNRVLDLSAGEQTIQNVAVWLLLFWLLDLRMDRRMKRFRIMALSGFSARFLDWLLAASFGVSWFQATFVLSVFCTALPFGLVRSAFKQHRRLDHSRWLLAIFACLQQLVYILELYRSFLARADMALPLNRLFATVFTLNGNPVDARTLVNTLLLLSMVYAVYRYSAENRRRQSVLEQEFKSAREIQQVLIPETIPPVPGFALTSAYHPAQQVGGDFFQIIPITGKSTLIVLGDVSGKGLRAAMSVSFIIGVVNKLAEECKGPAQILTELNRLLTGRLHGGFATCIALCVDSNGACTIASAGHPGPFLNGQELVLPGSLPLGLTIGATYDESAFSLKVNDQLNLYTDGLLEARNPAGELFGFERLQTLFASNPKASESSEAAVTFGQDDDITVLALTRLSQSQEATSVYSSHLESSAQPIASQA